MRSIIVSCLIFCIALTAAYNFERQGFDWFGDVVQSRIIGGEDAVDGQFPHQASLRSYDTGFKHFCGATIITNRFLLTAAFCTQSKTGHDDPRDLVAVVGSVRQDRGTEVPLAKIIPHEGFNPELFINDICLLQTVSEIEFSNTVQPIALPSYDLPSESAVTVSGWGRDKFPEDLGLPNRLKFLGTKTISVEECKQRLELFKQDGIIHNSTLCTINKGQTGICFGDAGGPLINDVDPENKFLVGLASFAVPCGRGHPDGYTRVHSYVDWIHSNMESSLLLN